MATLKMKISGLTPKDEVTVPAKRLRDYVDYTQYIFDEYGCAVKLEIYDSRNQIIFAFYGNGENDLAAKYQGWRDDPNRGGRIKNKEFTYTRYEAPDGRVGSYSHFVREAERGHLHGCTVSF